MLPPFLIQSEFESEPGTNRAGDLAKVAGKVNGSLLAKIKYALLDLESDLAISSAY
jgi:hypothetical protein